LALVPAAEPGGIDDEPVGQPFPAHHVAEHRLRHRRPANVAEADEQDAYLVLTAMKILMMLLPRHVILSQACFDAHADDRPLPKRPIAAEAPARCSCASLLLEAVRPGAFPADAKQPLEPVRRVF